MVETGGEARPLPLLTPRGEEERDGRSRLQPQRRCGSQVCAHRRADEYPVRV